jgi:hypothetical protein
LSAYASLQGNLDAFVIDKADISAVGLADEADPTVDSDECLGLFEDLQQILDVIDLNSDRSSL